MLEPVTFIAPLGTWKMDVEKSWKIRISSRMMMVMRRRRMMMMMLMMMMVMMTRHCEGAIWREFPSGGGSLSPGRSRIRGPARPFASQSKTQGRSAGGYLSWHANRPWDFGVYCSLCSDPFFFQDPKYQNHPKQTFMHQRLHERAVFVVQRCAVTLCRNDLSRKICLSRQHTFSGKSLFWRPATWVSWSILVWGTLEPWLFLFGLLLPRRMSRFDGYDYAISQ